MKTPDYVITSAFTHYPGYGQEGRTLPEGSFVRPIEFRYLPKEFRDDDTYKLLDRGKNHEFCYTRIGIVAIPKSQIRKV